MIPGERVVKNDIACWFGLGEQINHFVQYLAICHGHMDCMRGIRDALIERKLNGMTCNPTGGKKVDDGARSMQSIPVG